MSTPTHAGPESTSPDWRDHAGSLIILPVGALEQHATHLPLCTDTIKIDYFARRLAETLGCALWPTLPICQSYEHTGFRGGASFRPETVMAMIRDLADEAERQSFTRMVVLNGHGGNYALPTVVRDINRADRAIKLLLINYGDADHTGARSADDIHAGDWETSVMLALFPDMVGPVPDTAPEAFDGPAERADLNHLGMAVLRPGGAWGDPRRATVEKGRASVASIEENLPGMVRERLRWLDQHPRYGG